MVRLQPCQLPPAAPNSPPRESYRALIHRSTRKRSSHRDSHTHIAANQVGRPVSRINNGEWVRKRDHKPGPLPHPAVRLAVLANSAGF